MDLGDVIHRAVTDEMFVAHLQEEPEAALATLDVALDNESIEIIRSVFRGAMAWKELCSPALTLFRKTWTDLSPPFPTTVNDIWATTNVAPRYAAAMHSAGGLKRPLEVLDQSKDSLHQTLPGLCCEAAGGDRQSATTTVSAWGLLYTALHLFDDVEDQDIKDVPWAGWGAGPAINIATGLLISSNLALENLERDGISTQTAQAIRQDFYQTILTMCGGQHDDLTLLEPNMKQCWQIAAAKSGAFFALGCRAGARLATDDLTNIHWFAQFGQHLGMLVQISDDISDLWADGKRRSDLIADQRWTLPIAYAMTKTSNEKRNHLRKCLRMASLDASAEAEARHLVIKSGAILYLIVEAKRHYYGAQCALLQATPPSASRDALLSLLATTVPVGMGNNHMKQSDSSRSGQHITALTV
jgi:geranylgeranyl diphosphate synthase, type I